MQFCVLGSKTRKDGVSPMFPQPYAPTDLYSQIYFEKLVPMFPQSYVLGQGSSTFFSPRTPWLRETLSSDPHPRRPKFGPDIHIFYLELSVSHTHTHTHTNTHTHTPTQQLNYGP